MNPISAWPTGFRRIGRATTRPIPLLLSVHTEQPSLPRESRTDNEALQTVRATLSPYRVGVSVGETNVLMNPAVGLRVFQAKPRVSLRHNRP